MVESLFFELAFALMFAAEYSYWLLAAIALMAVLYSSVGHGGASGYLAAMALWGLAPEEMRPAALAMNIVVTSWLLYRFQPYKLMPYKMFWPLVIVSTPAAFIFGWCTVRQSTAVAAGFILLNSIGGLAGYMVSGQPWPPGTGWLMIAAFAGCLLGAEIASHRATPVTLRKLLAAVLMIAAAKMIYSAF